MCVYGNKITPVYIFDNGTQKNLDHSQFLGNHSILNRHNL